MINWEVLEDTAIFGFEESLDFELASSENGWLPEEDDKYGDYQGDVIAEALYCHYIGLDQ